MAEKFEVRATGDGDIDIDSGGDSCGDGPDSTVIVSTSHVEADCPNY